MPWFGPLFRRPDGVPATDVPPYRQMMPYLMRRRMESNVYFDQQVDLSKTTDADGRTRRA